MRVVLFVDTTTPTRGLLQALLPALQPSNLRGILSGDMHLLIDGHNLIGQLPGISLAAADDEAQLVLLLRRYATQKRGRQVVVVFDHGVYGHPQQLDGYGVRCAFAKSPQDADAQLIRRIKAIQRPGEWALVSSDRRVAAAARERGVRVIGAQEFAARLLALVAPSDALPAEPRDLPLDEAEVAEWLRLFGEQDAEGGSGPETPPLADDHHGAAGPARRSRRRHSR